MNAEQLNAKANELLPELRKELGDSAKDVSDAHLLKFLRWKPDVQRAAGRFRAHVGWKRQNMDLFDETLRISKDPQLERLLQTNVVVAPPQCRSKVGGPLVIGRLRNNDMKDGRAVRDVCRMMFYTIDRVLEDPEAQLHGVTIVHDLRGFDRSRNAHLDIPKTILGGIIGHFPIRIRAIYLWEAPFGFGALFKVMSMLLFPKKLKERCHFIKNLSETQDDIDVDMLTKELSDEPTFDSSSWVQQQKQRELDGGLSSLTDIKIE